MTSDEVVAALLLAAGLLWALPWLLAGAGQRQPPEGKVSPGWMRRHR